MSARRVLDSYAVLAFLENEPGAKVVAALIKQARDRDEPLLISVVNWGEVYYIVHRAAGKAAAESTMTRLDALPFDVVGADRQMALAAAEFKATRKMSYADCFAVALAKLKRAQLVTGDKEFRAVEGEVKIAWI